MKNWIALTFFLIFVAAQSQSPKPSAYEYRWALFHPFAALRVKKITNACDQLADLKSIRFELDSFYNGGMADAFRHIYYMAAYRQKIGTSKLRKLGLAHEKNNYRQFLNNETEFGEAPDSLGSIMDLRNNDLGIELGRQNKTLSREELKECVIVSIKAGNATIMKRNKSGNYVDCEGRQIDLHLYSKKWFVPKCLVSSGYSTKD